MIEDMLKGMKKLNGNMLYQQKHIYEVFLNGIGDMRNVFIVMVRIINEENV
jgi:hypothetical protein